MNRDRQQRVCAQLQADESLIVTAPVNIRYLSGYTGSNGLLLVTAERTVLFTDSRYDIQANAECSDVDIFITRDLLGEALKACPTPAVVIEGRNMSVVQWQHVAELAPQTEIRVSKGLVEALRVTKDPFEIELISRACGIATAALTELSEQIHEGQTERQMARQLEDLMRDRGADGVAFTTILATGPNTAIPHHEPTHRILGKGELIKVDFGALVDGYHSDCTRMFVCGSPAQWQLELFAAVKEAQSAGRAAVKAGVTLADVDSAARGTLAARNMSDLFTHGLGHGVGLNIHEDPFLRNDATTTLKVDTVVTVEPGAYLANVGGVRIEDTILVTQDGYQNLTVFPYDLVSVG